MQATLTTIDSKELCNILKILSGVVQKNAIVPAYQGVLINNQSITGGNDVMIINLPFENELPECLLDFETLYKMATSLNGVLEVKDLGKSIEFKSLSGKITVPKIEAKDEYPVIVSDNKHKEFNLTLDEVFEINRLIPFVDPKDDRFKGIFYNGLAFYGSSGACFGSYEKITDKSIEIIVYPEVLKALIPISADFYLFKDGAIKAVKNDKLIATIDYLNIQMSMPKFDLVTPKNLPFKATGTYYDFKQMISLLSISVNQRTNISSFEFLSLSLIGRAKHEENNKESECQIDIETEGLEDVLKMGINIKLFDTCINYLESESVSVEFERPDKATIISGPDTSKKCLLMPFTI